MVVDDDPSICMLLRMVLELDGWDVREVGDGAEALVMAAADPPHAMVLDVMLPGRDGFDVLAELRQTPHGRGIAIVMLTAKSKPADIARGTRLGADQYITKPFDPDELVDRLALHALRRHPGARAEPDPDLRR